MRGFLAAHSLNRIATSKGRKPITGDAECLRDDKTLAASEFSISDGEIVHIQKCNIVNGSINHILTRTYEMLSMTRFFHLSGIPER